MDIHRQHGDASLVAVRRLHFLAEVVEVLDGRDEDFEIGERFSLRGRN